MPDRDDLLKDLLNCIERRHPRSLTGVRESIDAAPQDFRRIAGTYLQWCHRALGSGGIERAVDAFARFSSDVNLAQGRYELCGHYENRSYEECRREVYDAPEIMTDYLWGVYLSNFLWAHHLDLMGLFESRFLPMLARGANIVEIAPGHGGWGLWALHRTKGTRLQGFDISATSIDIASALARASGLDGRAAYVQGDALELAALLPPQAHACICCFLVEHLEQPARLMQAIRHVLAPGGVVYFTGALTAAQIDHIYEFRLESEFLRLAEDAGFRVLDARSVAPARRLRKARFLPRSMAMVMRLEPVTPD